MTNPNNPFDVNNDSLVTPRDALIVINKLNGAEGEESNNDPEFYPDVSGDGVVAPIDILLIINLLNEISFAAAEEISAEGEAFDHNTITIPADTLLEQVNFLGDSGILSGVLPSELGDPLNDSVNDAWVDLVTRGSLATQRDSSYATTQWSHESARASSAGPAYEMAWELDDAVESISDELLSTSALDDELTPNDRTSIFADWPVRWDSEDEIG
jgi:hypothetical protein